MNFSQLFRRKNVPDILREAEQGLADGHGGLRRTLGVRDLTFFGIAAVIGTGVFTAIGEAAFNGGPGVIFLFMFTAVACGFAAYCYAEFASMVPISGSAYTYAYVAFGELFAWIIGWDLLMEYAIGNIAVAISWSGYFVHVVEHLHIGSWHAHIPRWMTMDYFSARTGFNEVKDLFAHGKKISDVDTAHMDCYHAWQYAPTLGPLRIIMNIPSLAIVALITLIVYVGIRESRTANNIMVFIKIIIILLVIVAGAFFVDKTNWNQFTPHGLSGIMASVSAVFFAYIGFDAISTTAEECKDPQRDLPKAMFYTLFICTGLYILLALVLTGMVHYSRLKVDDPLAFVFSAQGSWLADRISTIISVSAIVVIASVLLVYQMGQPRIWMSMSRDGLLWKRFSNIHPRFKTPSFATVITGLVVAIPSLFLNLDVVLKLTSIGTLFAFVLVCGGVLVLQRSKNRPESKFRTPFIPGKYLVPIGFIAGWALAWWLNPDGFRQFFTVHSFEDFGNMIPMLLFLGVATVVSVLSYLRNYSLIPVLGMISCFYLMTGESVVTWARFFIWLVLGLLLYFVYGFKHSKLGKSMEPPVNG